jgi:hypothetical protein
MGQQAVQPHPGFEKAAEWWLGILVRLFPLPRPDAFPPLRIQPTVEERQVLRRFLRQVARLPESEALNGPAGLKLTANVTEDGSLEEEIESTFPSYEATSGLAVLFRQLYSPHPKERASFHRVMTILRRVSADGTQDEALRLQLLGVWGKAFGMLGSKRAERLAAESQGVVWPEDDGRLRPEQVISVFMNAEHLHWDKEDAAVLESRTADPVSDAFFRYEFFEAVAPIAFLLLLFSHFVSRVLKASGVEPPPGYSNSPP